MPDWLYAFIGGLGIGIVVGTWLVFYWAGQMGH